MRASVKYGGPIAIRRILTRPFGTRPKRPAFAAERHSDVGSAARTARVLYLTYDGLTDPLGQSQILPYLQGLAARGHRITVLSCEKNVLAGTSAAVVNECRSAGIHWYPLKYHKRPPILSTVLDLVVMAAAAQRLHRRECFDVVHCRSYLPALIGRRMQRKFGIKFLFDMRGFWVDERFERGIWNSRQPAYMLIGKWLRRRERDLFQKADAVVSLTDAGRQELQRRGGIQWAQKTTVIRCCADLKHFDPRNGCARQEGRALLGINDRVPVLLFLGSLGGAYPLVPVVQFFRRWAHGNPDAQLLFVTPHPRSELLRHAAVSTIANQVIVRSAARNEVPILIAAADAAVSFVLPSFCAVASSPTKVGEILSMGVPLAVNAGVGDIARMFETSAEVVLLPDLEQSAVDHAAAEMRTLRANPTAIRRLAERLYSLDVGIEKYDRIYLSLLENHRTAAGRS